MKIQLARTVVLGLTAWAATLVVAEAEPADAASRRVAGLTCVGYAGHHDGAVWYQNEAEYDPDTTEVECPVQSDSTLSHSTVVTLNVYGSEATGRSNWSRACVRDNDSLDDAACGPTKNWGSGTRGARGVNVEEWQAEPSHFPYVLSKLDSGTLLTGLFGIYMAN